MFASLTIAAVIGGCGDPAAYRFDTNLTGLRYEPASPTEGIHPDRTVLQDPRNPFVDGVASTTTRWQLLPSGAPVAAFYAFATQLAYEPTGENQFYAAKALEQVAATRAVVEGISVEAVETHAMEAYQAVLDHFPDALGYDATGTVSYRLATPAYRAILALGGSVRGDWLLVKTASGTEEAVRGSPPPKEP